MQSNSKCVERGVEEEKKLKIGEKNQLAWRHDDGTKHILRSADEKEKVKTKNPERERVRERYSSILLRRHRTTRHVYLAAT